MSEFLDEMMKEMQEYTASQQEKVKLMLEVERLHPELQNFLTVLKKLPPKLAFYQTLILLVLNENCDDLIPALKQFMQFSNCNDPIRVPLEQYIYRIIKEE